MDKLIALKAMRNSNIVVGAGFVISLVCLVLGKSPAIMLNIIFLSFSEYYTKKTPPFRCI